MSKRSIEVEVAGYKLRGSKGRDEQYLRQVALYVETMVEAQERGSSPSAPLPQIALQVALNLADELFQERERRVVFRAQTRDRVRSLQRRIAAGKGS